MSTLGDLVYEGLPEVYRDADAPLGHPLQTYLEGLLTALEPVVVLKDRLTYTAPDDDPDVAPGGTSDLVDPATADAGWLAWLSQLVGVPAEPTTAAHRTAIANAEDTWAHSTRARLTAAAQRGLTGTKTVQIVPHYQGDPYVIGIGTMTAETDYIDTFAKLKAIAPRWSGLHNLGSFANAKAPTTMAYAAAERPAGYRLAHFLIDESN